MGASLAFVSFDPADGRFSGSMSIDDALEEARDTDTLLTTAAETYQKRLRRMAATVAWIQDLRQRRQLTPAQAIWELGDEIFQLGSDLASLGLQLDGVYQHLERDLHVKRKWLEKVVILRRYVPDKSLLPEGLNWGQIEKGTRRAAERIARHLPPHTDG